MPKTKQRPSTSSAVPKTAIQQAGSILHELPEKPRETWSLREAVVLLKDPITTALNRGYNYEEVLGFLSDHGIEMTLSSLKRYLAAARRDKGSSTTKTSGRRSRQSATATQAELVAEPTAAPTPAKRTSRKSSGPAVVAPVQPAEEATKTPTRKRSAGPSSRSNSKTAAASKPTAASKTAAAPKTAAKSRTAAKANPKPTSRTKTSTRSTRKKSSDSSK